jgi:hypothetical protein
MKAEDPANETITDDLSASAFVEQFGLDVFERADNAVRANRVTRYGFLISPLPNQTPAVTIMLFLFLFAAGSLCYVGRAKAWD